jgi:hypothetical protein
MNALGKVSAGSVLLVAGQVYASDPDRWEDCARRPEYDRLARFAWRLALGVTEEEDRLRGIEIKELMDKHTPEEKQP